MVLGFSWLVEKVMNKRKEQGIRLIVVKGRLLGFADNEFFKDGFGSYYSTLVATKIYQVRIWIGVHLIISFLCKCI
jgi:hypothetical protein